MSNKYVRMPSDDYKNICDAVREKTGKTELLKSGDIPSEISNMSGDSIKNIGGYITAPIYKTVNGVTYRLVWQDNFEGSDLDRNFWTDYYGLSNTTDRYLARADYWVENSKLNLRIKKDSLGRHSADDPSNTRAMSTVQTCDINGAFVDTVEDSKHDVNPFWGLVTQEGYYECRFKCFDRTKGGSHFAWWSTGMRNYNANDNKEAEIDYCEIGFENGITTQLPHGMHPWGDNTLNEYYPFDKFVDGVKYYQDVGADFAQDFQTLGIRWENGVIEWYVNGFLVDTMTANTPQYPVMHYLSIYDAENGTKATEDLVAQVDYLRIYKKVETESEKEITISGQTSITINGNTADLAIDKDRGCPNAFPQYVYINWSDGSRTEHWVQWDQQTTTWETNIQNQTSFEWTGRVYKLGIEVKANITF